MKTSIKKLFLYLGFATLLTLILYGKTLTYPFFFDDAVNFRLPQIYSLSQIWITAEGFPYFRPFTFAIWKIVLSIWGRYPPMFLHGMLLALHAVNGGLIGWLLDAERDETKFRFLPVAGISLFIFFPFSYQAIIWVASLFHPLVTFLILATIVFWIAYRRKWRWGIFLAFLTGFLAPFAHESGVLVGPLVSMWTWFSGRKFDRKTFYLWLSGVFFFLFWLFVPKTRDVTAIQDINVITLNIIYFLQGLIFPLLEALEFLNIPRGNLAYTIAVEVAGLALLGMLFWNGSKRRLAGKGWIWFILAAAPSVILLPFSYVIDGPRLLYLASVGIVLVWVAALGQEKFLKDKWRTIIVSAALIAILLLSFRVIQQQLRFFDWGARIIWSIVSATETTPDDGPVLFINIPAWFSSHQSPFKVGHDGATMIAEYAPLEDLTSINGAPARDLIAVTFPDILQEMDYNFGFYGAIVNQDQLGEIIETVDGVWNTHYTHSGPELFWAGRVMRSQPSNVGRHLATFDDGWELLESELLRADNDKRFSVRILWRCGQHLEPGWTIFLHVYDETGQILEQGDGDLLMNTYALSNCPEGAFVEDVRHIEFENTDSNMATIGVGLYNRQSQERMNARKSDGALWYNDTVIIWNKSNHEK